MAPKKKYGVFLILSFVQFRTASIHNLSESFTSLMSLTIPIEEQRYQKENPNTNDCAYQPSKQGFQIISKGIMLPNKASPTLKEPHTYI